ncbi:MAG: PorP/SprF family type IX secretion system membrane protein [Bacteroidales bacterium]|nr:PorP/SprF family type IX secretion system membrane protein [Bacteroidales bacterium]MBN2821240.1 PorP/SprF family type IX secretion system membrane protein [Bacteroidales bacterium]
MCQYRKHTNLTAQNLFRLLILFYVFLLPQKQNIYCQTQPDLAHYMAFNPLINTAAINDYDYFTAFLYGRRQWVSINGAPLKTGLELIQPFQNNSAGLSISQESYGVHNKQRILANYSHRVKLMRYHTLSFGLGGGAQIISSNFTKIKPFDPDDEQFGYSKSVVSPDFSFGMKLKHKDYYVGIAIPSLISTEIVAYESEYTASYHAMPQNWIYYLHGGYKYNFKYYEQYLQISSLVKIDVNSPVDADLNMLYSHNKYFSMGISYRTKREILYFGQLQINERLKAGYCYHSNFNLNNAYLAGHELYVQYSHAIMRPLNIQSPRF